MATTIRGGKGQLGLMSCLDELGFGLLGWGLKSIFLLCVRRQRTVVRSRTNCDRTSNLKMENIVVLLLNIYIQHIFYHILALWTIISCYGLIIRISLF